MSVGKILSSQAQSSVFKQTKGLTGGLDKKLFKAFTKSGTKISKKGMAREILWLFGGVLIALLTGFIVFWILAEFLTPVFANFAVDYNYRLDRFYYTIVLICFGGVYLMRLILWAIRTLLLG